MPSMEGHAAVPSERLIFLWVASRARPFLFQSETMQKELVNLEKKWTGGGHTVLQALLLAAIHHCHPPLHSTQEGLGYPSDFASRQLFQRLPVLVAEKSKHLVL